MLGSVEERACERLDVFEDEVVDAVDVEGEVDFQEDEVDVCKALADSHQYLIMWVQVLINI